MDVLPPAFHQALNKSLQFITKWLQEEVGYKEHLV